MSKNIQITETIAYLKARSIDLSNSNFEVPETGIYDEPVRYYKANEQWSALIEGLVSWLAEITAWQDTESDNDYAPQQIMIFLQGIDSEGLIVTTTDELCEAVKCGILEAIPVIGATLAAGLNSGISVTVDEEGNVIVADGTSGGGSGGVVGTSEEILFGSATEVYNRILEYMQDFEDFYQAFPSSQANTKTFFTSKYLLTANIDQAISDYYDYRDSMGPVPAPLGPALKMDLYCEGIRGQTVNAFIVDNVASLQLLYLSMVSGLSQDQYDQWSELGAETPRLGFTSAPCYRFDPVELTITTANFSTSAITWITNGMNHHRIRMEITVTAPFLDATGKLFDGVYLKPSGGSASLSNPVRAYNPPAQTVADAYPAFLNGTGKYTLEFAVPNTLTGTIFYPTFAYTPVSGEITIKIFDLGAY